MIKHTPGPWWTEKRTGVTGTMIMGKHRGEGSSYCVATVHAPEDAGGQNSAIVSTAPEMYRSLKRARDMLSAVLGDIEDGYSLAGMREKYATALLGARDDAWETLQRADGVSPVQANRND